MARTAITLKFKMCLFLDEECFWAETLFTNIILLPFMPDEDSNFSGSLVLDFRKWWRHVQPKNCTCVTVFWLLFDSLQSCLWRYKIAWPGYVAYSKAAKRKLNVKTIFTAQKA